MPTMLKLSYTTVCPTLYNINSSDLFNCTELIDFNNMSIKQVRKNRLFRCIKPQKKPKIRPHFDHEIKIGTQFLVAQANNLQLCESFIKIGSQMWILAFYLT